MDLLKFINKYQIVSAIIIGLLSLFILVFGTICVFAGFATEEIWYWYSEQPQYVYLSMTINVLAAGLLGIGIAKKLKSLKRIGCILNLIILALIIAGYAFFLWVRFSH